MKEADSNESNTIIRANKPLFEEYWGYDSDTLRANLVKRIVKRVEQKEFEQRLSKKEEGLIWK